MKLRNIFTVDFETTTHNQSINSTRIWVWGKYNIYDDSDFTYGLDMDSFFNEVFKLKKSTCYFHNLKFDGEFILYFLLAVQKYEFTMRQYPRENQISTLISDMGTFYSFKVRNYNGHMVEFRDSSKIIPLAVEQMPRAFGLEESKGSIDYHKIRPVGYIPTENEISYLKHDCSIVGKSLLYFFSRDLTRMTQGSNAFHNFVDICGGNKNFRRLFPLLENDIDDYLRPFYKGGFVYLNPKYKDVLIGRGINADVNSLFPSRMIKCKLPYGLPVYFKGEYKQDSVYDVYVIHLKCMFEIKKGKLPTIQIKKTTRYAETEYLTSSNHEIEDLYLTSVDLKLFLDHYEIGNLTYIDGYKFKSAILSDFIRYVDYWNGIKEKADKQGNYGLRTVAKYMLNTLYGKFGLKIWVKNKIPYYCEERDCIRYTESAKDSRDGVYLPVAIFITAEARDYTIRQSQKVRDYSIKKYGEDKYIYSDTDSIYTTLTRNEFKEIAWVDKRAIGAWDIEKIFLKGKFIHQKCYIITVIKKKRKRIKKGIMGKTKYDIKDYIKGIYNLKVTVSGLPTRMHDLVTYDNFHSGTEYKKPDGKLRYKRVTGGVLLIDTSYTIKELKTKKV